MDDFLTGSPKRNVKLYTKRNHVKFNTDPAPEPSKQISRSPNPIPRSPSISSTDSFSSSSSTTSSSSSSSSTSGEETLLEPTSTNTNPSKNLPIIFEMSEDNNSTVSLNNSNKKPTKISQPIKSNHDNSSSLTNNQKFNDLKTNSNMAHVTNDSASVHNNNEISTQKQCATNKIDELDKKSIIDTKSIPIINQRKTPRFPTKSSQIINNNQLEEEMRPTPAPKPTSYIKNKPKNNGEPDNMIITDLDDESPTNQQQQQQNGNIIKNQMFKSYSKNDIKLAVTINNSPAMIKKSQEIKGNINKMDRTINHVSDDINRIDNVIDKLSSFNRDFMSNLELLSDSELSSVVGYQSNAVQTDQHYVQPQGTNVIPNNQDYIKKQSKEVGDDDEEGSTDSSTEKESDMSSTESEDHIKAPDKFGNKPVPPQQIKPRNVAEIKNVGNNKVPKVPVRQDSELSSLPESSLCSEPEKRNIEGQVKYFHRQIKKNAGLYKKPGLVEGPKKLVVEGAPSPLGAPRGPNHPIAKNRQEGPPLPRPRSSVGINNPNEYRLSISSSSTESSGGGHFESSTSSRRQQQQYSPSNSENGSISSYQSGPGATTTHFQKAGTGRFNKKNVGKYGASGNTFFQRAEDETGSLSGKHITSNGTLGSGSSLGRMAQSRSYTSLNNHLDNNNRTSRLGDQRHNASGLLEDTDIRELVDLIRQHLELGYHDRIRSIFQALIRDNNRERIEDIIDCFKSEADRDVLVQIAHEAGYKLGVDGATNIRPAESIFDMRLSRTDLQNRLKPGLSMSSLTTMPAAPGFDTMTTATSRMVLWRADLEEILPPPIKPPPKPLPSNLLKSAVVSAEMMVHVDDHVTEVLQFEPTTFTELVSFLTRNCSNDVEKVRALFRWITMYDMKFLTFDPAAPNDSLIGNLRAIKSGQMTYNELFYQLCRYCGIHCQFISGYSKGAGYRPGMAIKDNRMFRNVWTAVYVAGAWRFVNCNWGARYLMSNHHQQQHQSYYRNGGTLKSGMSQQDVILPYGTLTSNITLQMNEERRIRCDEFYFLTDAKQHIFEHFPDKKRWQLLNRPITLEQFMALPIVKSPFFNANLSFKKNYAETLQTKNGKVTIKINMPKAVGVSCRLENRSDGSILRGLTLVQIVDSQTIVITAAPSQPGKFYLSVYVSNVEDDWRNVIASADDSVGAGTMEMACSFQIHCSEHNYDRLVTGRFPDVGVLGNTPAATNLGLTINPGAPPFLVWDERSTMKIPVNHRPGLRIGHRMMSYDRSGQNSASCDSYALLQRSQSSSGRSQYHLRFPVDAFYCLTVFAAQLDDPTNPLQCVYRLLIDCRRAQESIPPYPRQSSCWVDCRLLEPDTQALLISSRIRFRVLLPPTSAVSVAVVINDDSENSWQELSLSDSQIGLYKGRINTGDQLGRLSVYAKFNTDNKNDEEFIKLLDYVLIAPKSS